MLPLICFGVGAHLPTLCIFYNFFLSIKYFFLDTVNTYIILNLYKT